MVLTRFFAYVEIKTKIASLLPFSLGLVYAVYTYQTLAVRETVLFFVSMTAFDMTTTALNNYIDTKQAGTELPFTRRSALAVLIILLAGATASGIALAAMTNPVVLVTGVLCFLVGIIYTFGPAPLSRMPLGEVFSGLFMGFFIPFLTVLVNVPDGVLASITWQDPLLSLSVHPANLAGLFLISLPAVCGIAGIMLANNICDLQRDIAVKRYTLPYYLGHKASLALFAALYTLPYATLILAVILGLLHPLNLMGILTIFPVSAHIRTFMQKQDKRLTFPLSIACFILLVLPVILLTLISIFLS